MMSKNGDELLNPNRIMGDEDGLYIHNQVKLYAEDYRGHRV